MTGSYSADDSTSGAVVIEDYGAAKVWLKGVA
jgi:hypothetical protein